MSETATNLALVPEGYERRAFYSRLYRGFRNEVSVALRRDRGVPVNRFLIFAQGRTGSTLLTSSLARHSRIHCEDEILGTPRLFPRSFVRNLSRRFDKDAFGFHVKYYQLTAWQRVRDVGAWLRAMADDGWKIIHLYREDCLRQVVSNAIAFRNDLYHLDAKSSRSFKPIELSPDYVLKGIRWRQEVRAAEDAALAGLSVLRLSYERDLEKAECQADTFARIQDYIGVPQEPIAPALKKIVVRPLNEVIANYDDIAAALSDLPEGRYL